MQKLNFHKDKGDTEVFDKVTNEEPKEWTAVEFHKGAQEYVQENGEFEYEPPEPKGEVDWSARENEIETSTVPTPIMTKTFRSTNAGGSG